MSLYAEYINELSGKEIIESDKGFTTYYINNDTCYIEDIFVLPEFRKDGIALEMANSVKNIAKERGCKKLYGTVLPTTKGSTHSLRLLIEYGFKLDSALNNLIVLVKDI